MHRIISAALRQGRKWGWVTSNVADDATAPTPRKTELSVPSPDQVSALIREAARPASRAPEMAAVITLAALTGMRRGELCGLRWSDVDWRGSSVTVRQSIWQTSDGIGTKVPKTHQTRRLLLGEQAMAVLADRLARAQLAKVKLPTDGYIFSPDVDGANPRHPDTVTQAFTRLCRRMEAPALERLRETRPKATRVNLAPADRWDYRLHDQPSSLHGNPAFRRRAESQDRGRPPRTRRPVDHPPGVHGQHGRPGAGGGRLAGSRAEVGDIGIG